MRMHATAGGRQSSAGFAPLMTRTGWVVVLLAATTACGSGTDARTNNEVAAQDGACRQPLETRTREVPSQQPTRPDQTRACAATTSAAVEVAVVTDDLDSPWAVEPLPDGALLVTEKAGRMRIVSAAGEVGDEIAGVPRVDSAGQGGLLDVVLGPDFATDRVIYWSFSEPRDGGNGTSIGRGVLSEDRRRLDDVRIVFRSQPTYDGDKHFGSRLLFGPDGMLYMTLGERSDLEPRPQAQQQNSHLGKLLRLTPDGQPAPDNPFAGEGDARPEIWTTGHRNVQAAAFDQQGRLWVVDHGPQGGDELNLIERGKNYGWPIVTFGEEYSGEPVPGAVTTRDGYVDPVYYWDPVIAPSGAQFYDGSAFPEWKGNLFVGALRDKLLVRLVLEGDRVVGEEHLLGDRDERVRDVRQGGDGALYVVTDEGSLLRLSPRR
jgi:aldose sugar dehydrogenase